MQLSPTVLLLLSLLWVDDVSASPSFRAMQTQWDASIPLIKDTPPVPGVSPNKLLSENPTYKNNLATHPKSRLTVSSSHPPGSIEKTPSVDSVEKAKSSSGLEPESLAPSNNPGTPPTINTPSENVKTKNLASNSPEITRAIRNAAKKDKGKNPENTSGGTPKSDKDLPRKGESWVEYLGGKAPDPNLSFQTIQALKREFDMRELDSIINAAQKSSSRTKSRAGVATKANPLGDLFPKKPYRIQTFPSEIIDIIHDHSKVLADVHIRDQPYDDLTVIIRENRLAHVGSEPLLSAQMEKKIKEASIGEIYVRTYEGFNLVYKLWRNPGTGIRAYMVKNLRPEDINARLKEYGYEPLPPLANQVKLKIFTARYDREMDRWGDRWDAEHAADLARGGFRRNIDYNGPRKRLPSLKFVAKSIHHLLVKRKQIIAQSADNVYSEAKISLTEATTNSVKNLRRSITLLTEKSTDNLKANIGNARGSMPGPS
ncbi:MAG: hypothetical protein DHS80DRAFT_22376 [Piptocephalis tieghemiana]|nr:MAG: hypothetical protein DHS80DRAFT_22376 [Piptocephalis tieghemiana]